MITVLLVVAAGLGGAALGALVGIAAAHLLVWLVDR